MENFEVPAYLKELLGESGRDLSLARVIAEHRERYRIQTSEGELWAEITGNIRFTAQSRNDFPAVGDWVKTAVMDKDTAIILEILPRQSALSRQAVGKVAEVQVIAANIDLAFIVQSVGLDFNLNRLERYLSICYSDSITPVLLLTKTDLLSQSELEQVIANVRQRVPALALIPVSNINGSGLDELHRLLEKTKTYCFLGSSGVGKSTIINHLLESNDIKIREISTSTSKGKHTTTHRELFSLKNGSYVVDTPGMRELGMTDQSGGIAITFDEIGTLAKNCRYSDCTHNGEDGCAVRAAVDEGELDEKVYENYLKLMREQQHFLETAHEKNRKGKIFGKMVKEAVKERKKNKY